MSKKILLGIGGAGILASAGVLFVLIGGGQEQYAEVSPPQPVSLPSPVKKTDGDVTKGEPMREQREQEKQEAKDLTTGLPVSIASLDYEIARLEREKKIEELKKEIERIRREARERNTSRNYAVVPAAPPPVPPPPPPSPMMNFVQAQGGGEQPTTMRRPDWHVIGVACNEKCYATIRLGNGEVISVREGSTMPDGSTVVRIEESGLVEFSNNIRRPVNMSLAERERKETVKRRDTRQETTPSLPVVLPPREAPRVIENYMQR